MIIYYLQYNYELCKFGCKESHVAKILIIDLAQAQTNHLERRVKELQEQLQQVHRKLSNEKRAPGCLGHIFGGSSRLVSGL